jgi:hypothetical protein
VHRAACSEQHNRYNAQDVASRTAAAATCRDLALLPHRRTGRRPASSILLPTPMQVFCRRARLAAQRDVPTRDSPIVGMRLLQDRHAHSVPRELDPASNRHLSIVV